MKKHREFYGFSDESEDDRRACCKEPSETKRFNRKVCGTCGSYLDQGSAKKES